MLRRQDFFVLEYLIDLDPKAAAIRAGYAPRHAGKTAARLLRRPEIAAAIRTAMAERAARTGITAERIIEEYVRVAFVELQLFPDLDAVGDFLAQFSESEDDTAAALAFIAGLAHRRPRGPAEEERKALACLARILGLNLIEPERLAAQA
ncbi:MAG TPA: terminase small subunit [Stellaceae bacterium]|nr:terminase small subunit [Stellaceae bacterium]